jgi:hypothetical protein
VCEEPLSHGAWNGQVHGTWEQKHNGKANNGKCIQTQMLMLYSEIIAVCSQIHTKHTNILCGQNVALLNAKTGWYI